MLKQILAVNLQMFDEGAGAEGGAMAGTESTQPSATESESGEILYGKQPTPAAEDQPMQSLEERRKAYDEYIKGEGKEFYTKDTQDMINRRFKETKGLEEEVKLFKKAVAPLMKKYGVKTVDELTQAINDDDGVWEDRAYEEGLSIEQIKERDSLLEENHRLKQLEETRDREDYANRQYGEWMNESAKVQEVYPEFDLRTELANAEFRKMLTDGYTMRKAYETAHLEEILNKKAKEVSNAVSQNIRARGQRPSENGASNPAGVVVKSDPSKLTDKDIDNIIKRVKAGETISF